MNISIPTVADLVAFIAALQQYPLGRVILILLILSTGAVVWAWRWSPAQPKSTDESAGSSTKVR